jgi:Fe-S-cluster containining protein
MIEFVIEDNEIELKYYDPDTSLTDLAIGLEQYRISQAAAMLKTAGCKGCGECCSDDIPVLGLDIPRLLEGLGIGFDEAVNNVFTLPEKPDMAFRKKAIKEMARSASISELEATLLFEYNNAEPVIMAKKPDLQCCFLDDSLCSGYSIRPYSCGLYLCNMGRRLSYIQEMIIRQGPWHAYSRLGWISGTDIPHNPFLRADSYDELLVSDFEFKLENTLEQLFFYF